MKKSFVLYNDSIDLFNELSNEEAGLLIKAIFNYQVNKELPTENWLKIIFIQFKNQFIRNNETYKETVEKNTINGKLGNLKRYNEDLYNDVKIHKLTLEDAENIAKSRKISQHLAKPRNTSPNLADNDSDNDSDSDSVSDIYIYSQNQNFENSEIEKENTILNTEKKENKDIAPQTETLSIDTEYYNLFLNKWNLYSKKYKNRVTELKTLQLMDKQNLKNINLPIGEISKALFILFNQKDIIESCLVTPTHFLNHFDKYYIDGQEFEQTKKITQFYTKNNNLK